MFVNLEIMFDSEGDASYWRLIRFISKFEQLGWASHSSIECIGYDEKKNELYIVFGEKDWFIYYESHLLLGRP